jgi:hypothetical protein
MRALVILLLLITPGLVHAGTPAFVGKWKLSAVRTKDGPVPKEKLAGGGMTWHFKKDGSLAMTVWKGDQSVDAAATWKHDAKTKTLTIDESGKLQVVTWKVKSGKLEIAGTGGSTVVMTFVKTM